VIAAQASSVEALPNGRWVSASMAAPMLASFAGAGETSMPEYWRRSLRAISTAIFSTGASSDSIRALSLTFASSMLLAPSNAACKSGGVSSPMAKADGP